MATGRYSRIDGRKSSGAGSTVTIVVFVALCMVGVWVMTSSSLLNVQNSKVSEENKSEVTTEETQGNVENDNNAKDSESTQLATEESPKDTENSSAAKEDNSAKDNENSSVAKEDNSAKDSENSGVSKEDNGAKDNENSGVAKEDSSAKDNENSNVATEDNAKENDGKQKQFEDSQGDLPEDAIKVDNNERSNQMEKNEKGGEGMEASSDKMKGAGVGNKEEMKDLSGNVEGKKADGEGQVENKVSSSFGAAENEKKSDENSGQMDVNKQGDQAEKMESKNDGGEKKAEENSVNEAVEKVEAKVEGMLDNKNDGSEKRSEEDSGKTEMKAQDGQVEEKVESKTDNNEKASEEKTTKTDVDKPDGQVDESLNSKKDDSEKSSKENSGKTDVDKQGGGVEEKVDNGKISEENSGKTDVEAENPKDKDNKNIYSENSGNANDVKKEDQKDATMEKKKDEKPADQGSIEKKDQPGEVFPSGAQSELLKESTTQNGSFSTQATTSKNEKEAQTSSTPENKNTYSWKLCKTYAGPDYIPCLDNLAAINKLRTTKHYEHRERHCPENPPTCIVPVPQGYQRPIEWPSSRDKIWYHNVPHTKLAEYKGHQNWVKVSGEFLTFPGGGTQFKHGALHYIDFIQESVPDIAWGKQSRVVLDVGCGVASFGGFLFDRDVLTMSLAPKDEHEAQVQFALERGIPAISAVMGTSRLPYPARVFDVVHCARCRVPWHIEGGKLLLELNRLLRPGGFFVWSATPVYQKLPEDVEIWEAMKKLTKAMCWEVVSIIKDQVNGVGIAVYRKPTTDECYEKRKENNPPLCPDTDDPNAAWNVPLQACMHKIPAAPTERGSKWPEQWPARVEKPPYWLSSSEVGVYGKPAPDDFSADYQHWKRVVKNSYLNGLGIKWSTVRNVMDMRAVYGGLAAALREQNIWVMNVISIDAADTLPIIYERGLFGIYHDWCQSFSTYPRTYDLLHADHLFSKIKQKCNLMALVAETDRILRPEGKIIVRDTSEIITELETIFKSLQWDVRMTYSKNNEGMLVAKKTMWRPTEEEVLTYSIS
ncbi:probable methyltransferase PMT26 [Andrographis paniculata]|uniref:probable methyltransferase PMT26 n=1 Tax=Andrographis paniculata TaxID=175694 RepID=UPI0021E97C06|nr:probable methyltransferase PMT26 [Andrographis paniculata]XP_051127933.1 probable methyltransferase PMT26 [Andrographis paniculata]